MVIIQHAAWCYYFIAGRIHMFIVVWYLLISGRLNCFGPVRSGVGAIGFIIFRSGPGRGKK